jgi:ABC-type nitrate/sulfonate/bicarbonate transport system substrate-binding protein
MKMKMRLKFGWALAFVVLAAMVSGLATCQSGAPKDYAGPVNSVVIALPRLESSALFWVAEDQDLFAKNGLHVTFHEPDTGVASLTQLSKGEVDIAGTAEFPVVSMAFRGERIRTIACIDKADYIFLEGRKDREIETVSDLKGKRVGAIPGTIHAFYLGRFLDLNGMNMGNISLVDVQTSEDSVSAILDGRIDAVVVGEPFASSVRDSLGENAVTWRVQSHQSLYALIVSTEEWIETHHEPISRLLRSLAQAEAYAIANPAQARAIIENRLRPDASYMNILWSQNQYGLSLDESLILAMEDEARWMITNHLTTEKQAPNFLDYIYVDGLQTVKPEAVNVIR